MAADWQVDDRKINRLYMHEAPEIRQSMRDVEEKNEFAYNFSAGSEPRSENADYTRVLFCLW